jgi:hypothetical protein
MRRVLHPAHVGKLPHHPPAAVPAEQTTEVERLIAAAQDGGGGADVRGHILPLIFAGFVAYSVGVVGGFAVTKAIIED